MRLKHGMRNPPKGCSRQAFVPSRPQLLIGKSSRRAPSTATHGGRATAPAAGLAAAPMLHPKTVRLRSTGVGAARAEPGVSYAHPRPKERIQHPALEGADALGGVGGQQQMPESSAGQPSAAGARTQRRATQVQPSAAPSMAGTAQRSAACGTRVEAQQGQAVEHVRQRLRGQLAQLAPRGRGQPVQHLRLVCVRCERERKAICQVGCACAERRASVLRSSLHGSNAEPGWRPPVEPHPPPPAHPDAPGGASAARPDAPPASLAPRPGCPAAQAAPLAGKPAPPGPGGPSEPVQGVGTGWKAMQRRRWRGGGGRGRSWGGGAARNERQSSPNKTLAGLRQVAAGGGAALKQLAPTWEGASRAAAAADSVVSSVFSSTSAMGKWARRSNSNWGSRGGTAGTWEEARSSTEGTQQPSPGGGGGVEGGPG
jgi:hypothetical protein